MTRRTGNLLLEPIDFRDVPTSNARRLGISEGEQVTVTSRHGETTLPVGIDDRIPNGLLYVTFHDPASRVNHLTSPVRDRHVKAPEYKVTVVAVRPACWRAKA
jgi:formate dehydrogenase major subunit